MRLASSLSEWQLQAVLYKAKLTQYFETFISQGGDDIDQIMQCDENEFLEIMSLVGMASKPLHVRRLQRTLVDFSQNRAQFLLNSIPFIGLPPPIDSPGSVNSSSSSNGGVSNPSDGLVAALQFLIPGYLPSTDNIIDLLSAVSKCPKSAASSSSIPNDLVYQTTTNASGLSSANCFPALANSCLPSSCSPGTSAFSLVSSGGLGSLMSSSVPFSINSDVPASAPSAGLMPMLSSESFLMSLAAITGTMPLSNATSTTSAAVPPLQHTLSLSQMGQFSSSGKRIKLSNSPPMGAGIALVDQTPPPSIQLNIGGIGIMDAAGLNNCMSNGNANSISPKSGSGEPQSNGNNFHHLYEGSYPSAAGLSDSDMEKMKEFAHKLVEKLPRMEPRLVQNKKKVSRDLLEAMALKPDDPRRSDVFRHFAQIYGRFDAKRRPDKALTQHERVVNEAAAQVALLRPELLTRRDELFPLARKIARMAGFSSFSRLFSPGSTEFASGCCSESQRNSDEAPILIQQPASVGSYSAESNELGVQSPRSSFSGHSGGSVGEYGENVSSTAEADEHVDVSGGARAEGCNAEHQRSLALRSDEPMVEGLLLEVEEDEELGTVAPTVTTVRRTIRTRRSTKTIGGFAAEEDHL